MVKIPFAAIALWSSTTLAAPCLDRTPANDCLEDFSAFQDDFTVPYYGTLPLGQAAAGVTRAIIVVHGTNRNADGYFDSMVAAARRAGAVDGTLIIAPRFRIQEDLDEDAAGEPVWTDAGWKHGDASVWHGAPSHGSFEVVDAMLRVLGDRGHYPSLQTVIVTGFSAGGQFTHRYAAGSRVEAELGSIHVKYVVGSPSSYLYLDGHRPADASAIAACPAYDDYPYGLVARNAYMSQTAAPVLVEQFLMRDVAYLAGDQDTGTDNLDMRCSAMLEGPRRYPRALNFHAYLDTEFPEHRHHLHVIHGVAHDHTLVYASPEGLNQVFGSH